MKDASYGSTIALLLVAVAVLGRTVYRLAEISEAHTDLWEIHVDVSAAPRDSTPPFAITYETTGDER